MSQIICQGEIQKFVSGLTANAMDDDLSEFHDAGADMTIGKPLKNKLLDKLFFFCGGYGCESINKERVELMELWEKGEPLPEASERLQALAKISEGPSLIPA